MGIRRGAAWGSLGLLGLGLFLPAPASGPRIGTDDRARELVRTLDPGYRPWAGVLWSPPTKSVETSLFAAQASMGMGLLVGSILLMRRRGGLRP